MELPDLEGGYSLSNNAINAVLSVIRDCLESDNFEVPGYIPIPMLKTEIINTQLSLRAANYQKNKADIAKLDKLYDTAIEMENQMNQPTIDEQIAQAQQAYAQQAEQAQAAMQQGGVQPVNPVNPVNQVDLDMQSGQQGVTGWDGRTFDQAQQGQMV